MGMLLLLKQRVSDLDIHKNIIAISNELLDLVSCQVLREACVIAREP